ncbi:MAG: precorrin-3B C(17)-methyltransferase [Clostridia bacterium]|nr:precorrin-3B C(17)-methyltransferase [Clostridia bacterium]
MNRLYVVGIGAGGYEGLTVGAAKRLEECGVIVGYTVYCDLIKPYFPNKEYISTAMTCETDRCRIALSLAAEGKKVALICSGDAGVYGMASPALELAPEYGVEAVCVPGVTAACSGAALLGSPITCDFCVISLSDLLTPAETVEKRVRAAAECGICTVIYNPASKKRAGHLKRACGIFSEHRPPETVCGVVRNVGREGESFEIMTLRELAEYPADMFTTVFIGNEDTRVINGKMVTLRGYKR